MTNMVTKSCSGTLVVADDVIIGDGLDFGMMIMMPMMIKSDLLLNSDDEDEEDEF